MSLVTPTKKYNASDPRQFSMTDSVVNRIAGDLLPLSTVDSPHFKSMMAMAGPRYQVPSRKHLTTKIIPAKISALRIDLMCMLSKADSKICVTIDLWSSRQMRSYYGVTGHFITDWTLYSVMLACTRFSGSHTGDAIADKFQDVTSSFEISEKISHVVTDNASNMLKAFSLPGFEDCHDNTDEGDDSDNEDGADDTDTEPEEDPTMYAYIQQHLSCFAHTLQLVIKDGFKQAGAINKVLAKASAIVAHVRKSIHASEMLEPYRRLQTANATRWNSQLAMVRSILAVPAEKLRELNTPQQLTAYDRRILEDLMEILTPFESATHHVQGDQVVTGSMVVPCVKVLKAEMNKLSAKYSSNFVATLKASVDRRLSCYEEHDDFMTASALDPRFKLQWCSGPAEYDGRKANLMAKAKAKANATQSTPDVTEVAPSKKRKGFFSSIIDIPASEATVDISEIRTEVELYFSEACLEEDADPLSYWKRHSRTYPALARIAPTYLAIPASSAPVERLFSVAGKVFRPERCRLADKTFEQLMFLRCNMGL